MAPASSRPIIPDDRRYQLLVDAVVDYAVYMLDIDGYVATWNPGAAAIKGYTEKEAIGRHFSSFFTEEDLEAGTPYAALETARTTGRFAGEGWRVRKDGTRFWAMAVLDAVRDEGGGVIGFAKVTRDMTESRLARQAIEQSERRFRLLVESVTDYAIYMLDTDGRVTNWNAGAQRSKGYLPHEIIGENFSRFYTPEDREAGIPALALKTARETGRFEAEGWRLRKDGTRYWANVVIDPVRDETGELIGYAKITRDMTERREAQARLAEAQEQLFQSQKMEAIGQLTGGLAHDFNNLLTVVLGSAQIARKVAASNDRLLRLLNNIEVSAQRGAGLTRQLLAFARRQTLKPEVLQVAEQLDSAADLLRHTFTGDVEVTCELEGAGLRVEADPSALGLSLLNLGLNARDAGAKHILFNATEMELDDEAAGLKGRFVALSVIDDGSGIPAEIRDRIFEPFFTTKGVGEGTGLGLSQSYGFARQSGGGIKVKSEMGSGTTFTLYLPVTDKSVSHRGKAHGDGPRQGARVLVVEDDPGVAELAAELLREMGHAPLIVHDAAAGLEALSSAGAFDLVFSDIMMPGAMNGIELAHEVRRLYPGIPILLTTGYSEAAASRSPEFPVVAKPYRYDDLAEALARSLPAAA